MRVQLLLVCAALAARSGSARAGDADAVAVRKVIDAEVKAVAKQDPVAFGATLASDVFVMLPGGYAIGPDHAAAAMGQWKNSDHTIEDARLTKATIGHAGDVAWVTADLTLEFSTMDAHGTQQAAYRMTGLYTRDHATWKARALYASSATKDEPARWAGAETNEDVPGTDAAATAPLAGWFAKTSELAAHLHTSDDVVVLGSDTHERAVGTAAAAKLLGQWKNLAFDLDWVRAGGDGKTYAWIAGRMTRMVKLEGAGNTYYDVFEPYWALALAIKGAHDWEVVGVQYGQDPPSFNR